MLTHGAMQGCGLTSLVVCINEKNCDIRKRNVTMSKNLNYEYPFPRVSGHLRVRDIMEFDVMGFRV